LFLEITTSDRKFAQYLWEVDVRKWSWYIPIFTDFNYVLGIGFQIRQFRATPIPDSNSAI